jgi:FkbM family methyltransferase
MGFSEEGLLAKYRFKSTQPVLIDVGAHHGGFSRIFAEKGWRVIAFEPEQKNQAVFEQNLAGFKNVTCIPKAVSDNTQDKVPFYVSEEHYGIHALKPFHGTHKLAYTVETLRLDEVLKDLQVPEVTLLKVDTEGADFLAIKGFDFKEYRPELIMVEFMDDRSSPNFGYTHHDMVNYLKEQGYTAFVSEWAPIQEYAREGIATEPHIWLRCVPYPLDHEPAWGNLIFVPDSDREKFSKTLQAYLNNMRTEYTTNQIKKQVAKIPGAKALYHLIKGIFYVRTC